MTSTTQIQTNQRNAQFSTGPVTEEGKAVVSRNGMKHGLLSQLKVLPGLERQEDWDTHYDQILQNIVSIGCLETMLAERVALLLWRLGRVARYERDSAAVALEHVDEQLGASNSMGWESDDEPPIEEAEGRIHDAQQVLDLINRLTHSSDTDPVDAALAAQLLDELAEALDVNIYGDTADIELPNYPDGVDPTEVDWTRDHLRECLAAVAEHAGVELAEALEEIAGTYRHRLSMAQAKLQQLQRKRDQYLRLRIVPDDDQLTKITRYEISSIQAGETIAVAARRLHRSAATPRHQSMTDPICSRYPTNCRQ